LNFISLSVIINDYADSNKTIFLSENTAYSMNNAIDMISLFKDQKLKYMKLLR